MSNHIILVGTNGGCNPDKQQVKKGAGTVEWESESDKPCTIVFRGPSPFTQSNFNVPAKGKSERAQQGVNVAEGLYKYDVNVQGGPSGDPMIEIIP